MRVKIKFTIDKQKNGGIIVLLEHAPRTTRRREAAMLLKLAESEKSLRVFGMKKEIEIEAGQQVKILFAGRSQGVVVEFGADCDDFETWVYIYRSDDAEPEAIQV